MEKYPFLSDGWIAAARSIYETHRGQAPTIGVALRANLNITDVPFGTGPLAAHLDTSNGDLELDLGHLDQADVTLTMAYETAKAQVVDQDPQVVLQAFMSGRIKIEGDMAKLMGLATAGQPLDPSARAVAEQVAAALQSITE